MKKPTLQELAAYAEKIGFDPFDPEAFFDHYEMVGWVVGPGRPMRNWQAAVRNWRRHQRAWGRDVGGTPQDAALRERFEKRQARLAAQERENQALDELTEQIKAIASWRGHPRSPYADPDETIAAIMRKARDQYGPDFTRTLSTRVRATPASPTTSTGDTHVAQKNRRNRP